MLRPLTTSWEMIAYVHANTAQRLAIHERSKRMAGVGRRAGPPLPANSVDRLEKVRILKVLLAFAVTIVLIIVLVRRLGMDYLQSRQFHAVGVACMGTGLLLFLGSTLLRSDDRWHKAVTWLVQARWSSVREHAAMWRAPSTASLRPLNADMLHQRRNAWRHILRKPLSWHSISSANLPNRTLMLLTCMPILLQFGFQLSRGLNVYEGVRAGFMCASLPLCIIVYWSIVRYQGERLRHRLLAAINDQCCPDCGHGLAGMRPAHAESPELGPRLCPECAARWPLVPSEPIGFETTAAAKPSAMD